MPQPYDYSLNLPNPVESVLQGVAMRQQFEAQRAEARRKQQMQVDLQALQADPSPQSYANFYLRYPEMKEQLDAYRTTLGDADRNVLLGGARELMGAVQAGRDDLIDQVFDKHISALKESSRPDLAKQFEEAKQFYKLDPKAGQFAVRSLFQSLDPDGYKALADGGDPLDKQYALDVKLYGPEEATRLRYAQRMASGTVSASGPAGTVFKWMGDGTPTNVPPPAMRQDGNPEALTPEQYDAIVEVKGRAETDAYLKRNNIPVAKTVDGVTYYRIDGQWYDNPEGR